jgi:hypothetical protein
VCEVALISIMKGAPPGLTSRKHDRKEPQLFSHCGSFDHHDMQSLDDCKFENLEACNTPLERYFQDLSSGIFKAPNV